MKRPLKPRVLGDVSVKKGSAQDQGWDPFAALAARINLAEERIIRVPLTKSLRVGIVVVAAVFFLFGSAIAPALFNRAAGDAASGTATTASATTTAQRSQLEGQLAQLETQIDQYQGQIVSYATQGKTLSNQIAMLNDKIASLNLQIQATNLTVQQLNAQIAETQSQVAALQATIESKKSAMAALVQDVYRNDQVSLIQTFLQDPQLSDTWDETQAIALVQGDLRQTVQQISGLQGQLQDQETELEISKSDEATAAQYQAAQVAEVASTKSQEAQLLTATQGQESKYQTLLAQTQVSAADIRSQIFQLLGGGQLSFEDAYQDAQAASNATGMDPAFILAILDRESALGQNVGQCNYQTAMNPSDRPLFLSLVQSLGLNASTMTVSCPNGDGTYGGAMGPAQFVPSTWEMYAPAVAQITGNDPPSPWNDADAFIATALYLKDNMTGCQTLYSAALGQERCTAAKYYAGSRWQRYLWTYGEAVVEQTQSFASDIQTITNGGANNSGNNS